MTYENAMLECFRAGLTVCLDGTYTIGGFWLVCSVETDEHGEPVFCEFGEHVAPVGGLELSAN